LQALSIVTNVLLTLFAGIALYVGYRQILISNEIAARSAYESYHLLCMQHPRFSAGMVDPATCSAEEQEAYTVFVLYMLMTGERIYTLFPKDRGWLFAIEEDVRNHRRFISSPLFAKHLANQEWVTAKLIRRVLAEDTSNQPAGA